MDKTITNWDLLLCKESCLYLSHTLIVTINVDGWKTANNEEFLGKKQISGPEIIRYTEFEMIAVRIPSETLFL
jgi:hypothetical protein